MRATDPHTVIALAVGDIHLRAKPPLARSREADWLKTQAGYLNQLNYLGMYYGGIQESIPILCSGDIFDKADPPPEIVNFALEYLPHLYAIPGNHDLKHGAYQDLKKTAFWTLVKAGKVTLIEPGRSLEIKGRQSLRVHGFPYGYSVKPLKDPRDLYLEVALVHQYIWLDEYKYEGAPEENSLPYLRDKFHGYDVVIVGDNHKGFLYKEKNFSLLNTGGFMRTKMDEINYQPRIGLIHEDGTIKRKKLDVSNDRFLEADEIMKAVDGIGLNSFIEELTALGDCAVNFAEAVKRVLEREKVPREVRNIVLYALERKAT